jgi:hypothetical protein
MRQQCSIDFLSRSSIIIAWTFFRLNAIMVIFKEFHSTQYTPFDLDSSLVVQSRPFRAAVAGRRFRLILGDQNIC